MLQHAVNAVLYGDFGVTRFNVDVTCSAFECSENYGLHEFDDRAAGGVSREAVTGNRFFGILLGFGDLQRKSFGRLLEDALRLFRAFEQVSNLLCRGDTRSKFFAEE